MKPEVTDILTTFGALVGAIVVCLLLIKYGNNLDKQNDKIKTHRDKTPWDI